MEFRYVLTLIKFEGAPKNQKEQTMMNSFLSKEKKKIQSVEDKPRSFHISTQQIKEEKYQKWANSKAGKKARKLQNKEEDSGSD